MLKQEYEGQLEVDEAELNLHVVDEDEDDDFDYDTGKEYIRESAASPSVPHLEGDTNIENRTGEDRSDSTDSVNVTQGPGMYVVVIHPKTITAILVFY